MILENTHQVIGIPSSYYRQSFTLLDSHNFSHLYERLEAYVAKNWEMLLAEKITIASEIVRIGYDFSYLKNPEIPQKIEMRENNQNECDSQITIDTDLGLL